eukprot:8823259-Karenia_brevis.AAC.1
MAERQLAPPIGTGMEIPRGVCQVGGKETNGRQEGVECGEDAHKHHLGVRESHESQRQGTICRGPSIVRSSNVEA